MSPQEFKNLNSSFISALKEKFSEHYITTRNDPFSGNLMIGISQIECSSPSKDTIYEVYSLQNNGDVAQWSYQGLGRF